MVEQRWRVGDLARAVGLTVRTLHHYDQIGLLKPSRRTEAGHRLYTSRDVGRLYRILALRQLGLGLPAIAATLDGRGGDLGAVVRRQLHEVERQIEAQGRLRSRLAFILGAIERSEQPSTKSLIEAMEAMTMFERYSTPEQLAQLAERRALLGDDAIRQAEQQWAGLIGEAEAARAAGLDPASAPVQDLARRWKGLIEQFTGGDESIRRSLQTMYETEGVERASRGMANSELMRYMGEAMAAAHS